MMTTRAGRRSSMRDGAGRPEVRSAAATALPGEHVHGISRDPGSGRVDVATHEGLFVLQPDASWQQVGPAVDLMSFAITEPGTFYASGHPAHGVDLPAPVGLIKSTDAGRSWLADLATVPGSQALSASRDKAGRLEILVVTETGVLRSGDDGATLARLTS